MKTVEQAHEDEDNSARAMPLQPLELDFSSLSAPKAADSKNFRNKAKNVFRASKRSQRSAVPQGYKAEAGVSKTMNAR
jgi:hypothetical protein